MKHIKSERIKKLEAELQDLEQWLKLGLVPKKDIEKHKEEIRAIQNKIEEEKERLQFLKESGEAEEYIAPKRNTQARGGYTDMPTIPDIDGAETGGAFAESGFDMDTELSDAESSAYDDHDEEEEETAVEHDEEEKGTEKDEDDDSYFSDKNRWRRGGIVDPDANEW